MGTSERTSTKSAPANHTRSRPVVKPLIQSLSGTAVAAMVGLSTTDACSFGISGIDSAFVIGTESNVAAVDVDAGSVVVGIGTTAGSVVVGIGTTGRVSSGGVTSLTRTSSQRTCATVGTRWLR